MKFTMIAQMLDGRREELSEPEFVGEGLGSLADTVEAAKDALECLNGYDRQAEYVDIYCDENHGCSNGYCGFVDDSGWHLDSNCEIDG